MGSPTQANLNYSINDSSGRLEKEAETREVVETFKRDGYVVWYHLLDPALVSDLRSAYSSALDRKVERFSLKANSGARTQEVSEPRVLNDFKPSGGNHDLNRWNMHLASQKPLFDERLFGDPRIVSAVEELMGTDCVCYLVASDTPFPGAILQSAHQDFSRFSIAVNIPLVDCTEENAALEVWPGTHCYNGGSRCGEFSQEQHVIPAQGMRQIVSEMPSTKLLIPAGSAVMRDHRLVHRGTPNVSNVPRPMLSIYYVRPRPVPYRWVADMGVRLALFLRRWGRGRGVEIQRPNIFNLGNILGRIVEEYSLTDRDYRRCIPAQLWQELTPRARRLLRYACVEAPYGDQMTRGSLRGTWLFLRGWVKSVKGFVSVLINGKPRSPDEENH